jgi:four helix bundle protein
MVYVSPPMRKRPYEKLIAWQEAFQLCLWAYTVTKHFPKDERFGLISQIRRSATSVPLNIAEGNTRRSNKEKIHFFDIALGSVEELHCQLNIAKELEYMNAQQYEIADERINKTSYLLTNLRSAFI